MIGQQISHFRIESKLGQGGMGEVYRAADTKLGRDVAIKLLPDSMASDPERLARFEREARALASLNHPNVAGIHQLEQADGKQILVMELAEGVDLAERLRAGPLPLDLALDIARQLADGLASAHERGIIHRDLKPANIKIDGNGNAKILDFGLARAFSGEPEPDQDPALSPTITAGMTQQGVVLGTAAYMSPEQARGRPVDVRCDIWAWGVVLWEMLTGKSAFADETTTDTLSNVLNRELDFGSLPASTPRNVRRALRRCLAKDPDQRLRSIADALLELEDADTEGVASGASTRGGFAGYLAWALVFLLAVACGLALLRPWERVELRARDTRTFAVALDREATMALADHSVLAASPDGRYLALTPLEAGAPSVAIRDLDTGEWRSIASGSLAIEVFFSPDGKWIGYFQQGFMHKQPVAGGVPIELTPMSYPRGCTWSDDGYIYFAPNYSSGLFRVPADGSAAAEQITELDRDRRDRTHRWPHALPAGRGVLFTVQDSQNPGNYEDAEIAVYDSRADEMRLLGIQGAIAKWSPTGHLLVMRNGILHAVEFDLQTLEVLSAPVPIHDDIDGDGSSGSYYFSVTQSGDLFYIPARQGEDRRDLLWVDRDGTVERIDIEPGPYRYPHLNHDGTLAVLLRGNGQGSEDDALILDLAERSMTRLTFDEVSLGPLWGPKGEYVYFLNTQRERLMRRVADGTAPPELLDQPRGLTIPTDASPDGRYVFGTILGGPTLGDIMLFDLADSSNSRLLIHTDAAEWSARLSPDGQWLSYVSDETGREEVYVVDFPPTGARWQVSSDGGRGPLWSPLGDELFYVNRNAVHSVRVTTERGLRFGRPEVLFEHPVDSAGSPMTNYDVSPDASRFLVVEADLSRAVHAVNVELNWTSSWAGDEHP